MHKLREPSQKQIDLAVSFGLNPCEKSFRPVSAEMTNALELKSFAIVEVKSIFPGGGNNIR
ncbi:MAG: hypothetical protein L3J17_05385 [Candidatus Jettenia sp.]|nr:MAG: hypothetical protein L3J17_05385 [Candidatus Jettenia sp.]